MIDFHSHILPGVDDGAKDIEDSKKIIKEARNAGVEKIISTSHYALDCFESPEYKRIELIEQLKEELEEGDPELVLGSEIFLTYNVLELLQEFKASTIAGTKYILFELPLRGYFNNLKDLLNKVKGSEYKLILAHPERYGMVHSDFDLLYELKDLGVLMQCNYGSILGIYGMKAKSTVKRMLKEDLVGNLATAKALMADMGLIGSGNGKNITGEWSLADGTTPLKNAGNDVNKNSGANVTVNFTEALLNVDGNVTDEVIEDLSGIVEQLKDEIVTAIAEEMGKY